MMITSALAYIGLALSLLALTADTVLFAVSVQTGALQYPALRRVTYGAAVVYSVIWSLLLALAAAGLKLDALSMQILRWSVAVYALLAVLSALLEHEWMLMLPGLFAALTLPFFEAVFGYLFPYILIVMLAAGLVSALVQLLRGMQSRQFTLYSIQEAIDTLNDGVLFAKEDGTIVLYNRIMPALSSSLCRAPLQNALQFWDGLEKAETTELLTKVADGGSYLFRFAGGNTWTFHRETLTVGSTPYIQIIALNVTESDSVQRQTAAKRSELASIALQLRQVEATIGRLKEEEASVVRGRAAFDSITEKMAALNRFFTEHYALPAEKFDYKRLSELTAGLLSELEHAPALTAAQRLALTVSAMYLIGVRVEQEGTLPDDEQIADAVAHLLREAAINAVIHGGAGMVRAELRTDGDKLLCKITSDGAPLEGAFTPGGGITGIRRKLFPLGGTLEIEKEPAFTLQAAIPLSKDK